jgi:SAM-dependent methyltransferase
MPAAPASVLEIGCGPAGGFVPALLADGYSAIGVDPEAPDDVGYERVSFEGYRASRRVDAVVACTSLHHVDDLAVVLDGIAGVLVEGGVLVVVEWARERFDEATARWCFERLGASEEAGWVHRRREEWLASGQPWDVYLREWAEGHRLHPGEEIMDALDARFSGRRGRDGAYLFADLDGVSEADEESAIAGGLIQATRITYVGRRS